jgi:hypothetical protein
MSSGGRRSFGERASRSRPCWTTWKAGKLWVSSLKISPLSVVKRRFVLSNTPDRSSSANFHRGVEYEQNLMVCDIAVVVISAGPAA